MINPKRELLRHLVATLAFRANVAVSNAPANFADFKIHECIRTPGEILAHLGDLLEGSLILMRGDFVELNSPALSWEEGVKRFFSAVKDFDDFLASDHALAHPIEKITQGPISDALTHVGQIIMLRRAADVPAKSEGYFAAEIVPGKMDFLGSNKD